MVDLNNLEEIKKLDPDDVYGSVSMFPDQCGDVWEIAKKVSFPQEFRQLKNTIYCAMGGSMYGAYILRSLFHDSLKIPVVSVGDYHLPGFAGVESLVILSSYSGNTEEPLNCANEALARNIPLISITNGNGGRALEIIKENELPSVVFDERFNPSGQPRLGMGYMVIGTIGIFNNLGFVSVSDSEIAKGIKTVRDNDESVKKEARRIAQEMFEHIPLVIAAEHLNGNIHIIRNQINESAKSFSAFAELPELNHHLMEGLKNPADKKMKVLFINSNLYSDKLSKRLELTKDVVGKNEISWTEFTPRGQDKLTQVMEVLSFGGYLSFYMGILYGQDPSLIPWVDYFKEKLAK